MPKPHPRHLVSVTVTELRGEHTGNDRSGAHSRSPPFDTRPPRCEPTRTPTVARHCDQRFRRPVGVQLGCRRGDLNSGDEGPGWCLPVTESACFRGFWEGC